MSGTAWPHLLADLEAKRGAIDQMIAIVRSHFVGDDPTEMPEMPESPRANGKAAPAPRRRATDAPANGNGRKARTARPAKGSDEELILQHLRAAGEPVKPGELAKAMGLTLPTLRYKLKPLQKQRLVVITGTTASRRISLPGKQAKEEP